jgi:hypothetical protein
MIHDFIDTYVVFGFILLTVFIVVAACIDRYKSDRLSRVLNAEYLARVAKQNRTFEYENHERFTEFSWEVEAVHVARSSRSQKRVLRDRRGRIVASHDEEIVVADLVELLPVVKTPLLLPPAVV